MGFFSATKKSDDTRSLVTKSSTKVRPSSSSRSVTSAKKYRLRRPKLAKSFRKLSDDGSESETSLSGYVPPKGFPIPKTNSTDYEITLKDEAQKQKKKIRMSIKQASVASDENTVQHSESSGSGPIFDNTTEVGSFNGDVSIKQQETKLTEGLTAEDEDFSSDDGSEFVEEEVPAHDRFSQFVFDKNFQEIKSVEVNSSTTGSSIFSMEQVAQLTEGLRDGLKIDGLFRKKPQETDQPSKDSTIRKLDFAEDGATKLPAKTNDEKPASSDVFWEFGDFSNNFEWPKVDNDPSKRAERERDMHVEDYSLISSIKKSTRARRRDPEECSRKPDPSPKSSASHASSRGLFQSPLKMNPSFEERQKRPTSVMQQDAILGSMLFRKTSPMPKKIEKANEVKAVPRTIEMTGSMDSEVSGITEVGGSKYGGSSLGIRPMNRNINGQSIRNALMETYNMFEP